MRLENEQELVIPADGLYFIYAQVVFKGMGSSEEDKGASNSWNGCSGRGSSTKILSLSVERWSDAYPVYESILSTSRSICLQTNQGGVWTVPLYQGALFKLAQGDKLKVNANLLNLINDSKTFFGAFAV
ncbi:lymphotoxin-alpha-like [Polyodon spathula]|nr:lymphotoxin-alpha-like [Polyodon spathula]